MRAIYLGYANAIAVPRLAALHNTPAGSVASLVLVETVLDRTKDDGSRPDGGAQVSPSYSTQHLPSSETCVSHYTGWLTDQEA